MNPYLNLSERQIDILRPLRDARARYPNAAKTLHQLRLSRDVDIDALLALRILKQVDGFESM